MWAMARLDEAFTEGQLTTSEHLARLASARDAALVSDLDELLGDLQLPAVPDAPGGRKEAGRSADRRAQWRARAVIGVVAVAVLGLLGSLTAAWMLREETPANGETAPRPSPSRRPPMGSSAGRCSPRRAWTRWWSRSGRSSAPL
ncbi:hypothetical protein MTP03_32060 [Tsukamurella sp. PLM1]|nr:hypothetical protein MTP03_32060 [Tsukamurella sp. PLM1]